MSVVGIVLATGCSSSPQTCDVGGASHPVNQLFPLSGCGSCKCDAFGDVQCQNPACSGPGHPAAGNDGAAGTGADGAAGSGGAADARDSDG